MIIIPLAVLALIMILIAWIVSGSFMHFDDLMELRFLPSRKRSLNKEQIAEIQAKISPRGRCLHVGQLNSPWTTKRCQCARFHYEQMYYGQALCKCGDIYLEHAMIGEVHDQEGGTTGGAAVNNQVAGS